MRGLLLALLSCVSISLAGVHATAPPVEVEMRNVNLHMTPDIMVRIHHLSGTAVAAGARGGPVLDDPSSYRIDVTSGEVVLDLPSLNAVLTRTLGSDRSNVKNLHVSIADDGTLRQKGTIDKAIDIPFNVKGALSVTPDGRIRVHSESVKGYGVPVKPLMKVFGVDMDDLLHVKPETGVTVDGNDLILDPSHLLPPPVLNGRVSAVRIEGQSLVQTLGSGTIRSLVPPAISRNHLLWRGGQLTFGKLTMAGTDLEIIDDDPSDPLDFSAEHWNEQLVAGYSKMTARGGLQQHVPDYDDLQRRQTRAAQRKGERPGEGPGRR